MPDPLTTCEISFSPAGTVAAMLMLLAAAPASAQAPRQVSRTAIGTTCARAFMARDPDPGTRNPDYLAEKLLDDKLTRLAPDWCAQLRRPFDEAFRELLQTPPAMIVLGVTARTKHIDAALTASLAHGVRQVVILGAGFDSRAYRMAQGHEGVRFFEVDLPATQDDKKRRVRELFGSLPPQAVYVAIDFETQSLDTRLSEAGFDQRQPTFFVWEGVTMYLHAAAVDATLAFVATHSAPGSTIVFDYLLSSIIDGTGAEPPAARVKRSRQLDEYGEPWVLGIPEGGTEAFVARHGLELVSDRDLVELFAQYISRDIPAGFPKPFMAGFRMAVARVHR